MPFWVRSTAWLRAAAGHILSTMAGRKSTHTMLLISCAAIVVGALLAGVLSELDAPIWLLVVPSVLSTSFIVSMWLKNMNKSP